MKIPCFTRKLVGIVFECIIVERWGRCWRIINQVCKMDEFHGKQNQLSHHMYSNTYPLLEHFPRELRRRWFRSIDFRFLLILFVTSLAVVTLVVRYGQQRVMLDLMRAENSSQEKYTKFILDDMASISGLETDSRAAAIEKEADRVHASLILPHEMKVKTDAVESTDATTPQNAKRAELRNRTEVAAASIADKSEYPGKFETKLSEAPEVNASIRDSDQSIRHINQTAITGPRLASKPEIEDIKTQRHIEYNNNTNKLIIEEYTPYSDGTGAAGTDLKVDDRAWKDVMSNMRQYDGITRSPEAISRVLLNHNKSIQACYKKAYYRDSSVKGKISVRFSVDYRGMVKRVDIVKSTLNSRDLERCIVDMISSWDDFGPCDSRAGDSIYKQTYVFGPSWGVNP